MEKSQLVQFLSLLLLSSSICTLSSDPLFINCGSKNDVTVDDGQRTFIGDDQKSDFFKVGKSTSSKNSSVLNSGSDNSSLYQTARIYKQKSFYELEITTNGTYLVRLHFFPFISEKTNLSDALFDVSTSEFLLFSFRNEYHFQVTIKENFLAITPGKFRIYFGPATKTSFAFVNAIEAILLPQDLIPPAFSQTLYRLNVGGPQVERNSDRFWRKWVGDDQYIVSGDSAKKCTPFNGNLVHSNRDDQVRAPDIVYKTCKQMNTNVSNITWHFNVRKEVRHIVRLHFCDIISRSQGTLDFELYINSNIKYPINDTTPEVPFLIDFVGDSDDSGYINISVGPDRSSEKIDAFLNGLEIMEFLTKTTLELKDYNDPHKPTDLIIGLSIAGLVLLFVLIILLLFVSRHRRAKKPVKAVVFKDEDPHRPQSWITAVSDNSASPLPNLNLKLKMPLSEILAATNNFDTKLLIGEGGFGKVYKGILSNDMKVAVKRSHHSSLGQGLPEFQTEVTILSKIRHRHLVSLFGYCDEGSEMILVYEFMEKGTLRDHLYAWKENSMNTADTIPQLTWKQRLEICIGATQGLHYLHTGSDWGIIHRDVKSTNILLDEHYIAKVADFGLSQSGPPDPNCDNMDVKGSFGYLDPEYVRTLQLTYKSDVYSFGVVLLEVLCARAPIVNSSKREEINLAEWGMFWHKKGQLEKIVDPLLIGQINPNSLRKFGEIAERCLKIEGADRPTMLDICWDLQYALQLQQTAVLREPHEDSTTDVSSNYVLPASSTLFPNEEGEDDDDFDSTLVFSQSMIYGAR